MFSPPYVFPSFQRPCRHYTPWSSSECSTHRRSSSVPRNPSIPRASIAQQQQRAEQRAEQRRLIRAALERVAPASRRSASPPAYSGWHPRGAGAMLVEDARRAGQRLKEQEEQREQEWMRERLREESQWRREEERERWQMEREEEERWRRAQVSRRSEPPVEWRSRQRSARRSVQWADDY